ncbi:T9SS type A sorting domain-containing protein [Flavobacterium granuli]|uniref:Delta-60 repeat protein n=1 Tax=Flavobacterium granuli TaxID=280093 RepID=A0ABU1RX59_9FLAO|nr:T9SS type A sorting domain-containing protein [Flavobacterium granuli]MDR6843354.1 putative delta-60 repeat protein [Flavobacterium granuli]
MKKTLLFLFCVLQSLVTFAQNPADITGRFGPYPGFNGHIESIVTQPDGKIIIGGGFSKYRGVNQNCLIRLNTDGSKDTSFDIGTGITGFSGAVISIVLQPDGKIIVGGAFNKYMNTIQNCLIRLNSDGSKDTSFDIGTGFDSNVNSIVLQPDGKIIVSGDFWKYQDAYHAHLLRLNADGSKDSSFNIGTGFDGFIIGPTVLQPDGKIIVGGTFHTFQGTPQNNLIRLNSDGSKDTSFDVGTGFSMDTKFTSGVNSLALQADGKILVGGQFNIYQGIAQNGLIRLNSDGSRDTSFSNGDGFNSDAIITAITIQSDDKILVGGTFIFHGASENGLIRFNSNGSKDTSFDIGIGFDTYYDVIVFTICQQPDGKIIVGGHYNTYQGVTQNSLIRLNSNGSKDMSFNKTDGFDNEVKAVVQQADGKTLVGGSFTSYNGVSQNKLIRFNPDGSKDTTFNIGTGFNNTVNSITLQPDGKIIVGGDFWKYKGVIHYYLMRLNADGSEDSSFNIEAVIQSSSSIVLQSDGKILVGNDFSTPWMGVPQKGLIRLNSDGSNDSSFNVETQFGSGDIYTMALQNDGKILVGGYFNTSKGAVQNYLIRVNADGSKDSSFTIGIGFNNFVNSITVQPDGKILVGGSFTTYQGAAVKRLIRLNSDGSNDSSFDLGTQFNDTNADIILQKDGKIIIGMTRLNSDGSKDNSFDIGITGFDGGINSIALQPDGQILVGGSFITYQGDGNSVYLIRLRGTYVATPIVAIATQTNVTCTGNGSISQLVYGGKSPYSYLWSNGETTAMISGLAAGDYSCTVTDADSSTLTKSFTITTIVDTQNPLIIAPAKITVDTNSNCVATGVALGTPVTSDNCSVVSVTNNAPTTYPVGNTTVTWTAKDASNNTGTAMQIVTVREETLPTITAPVAVTVNTNYGCAAKQVQLGTPITADNCTVVSVTNNAPIDFPIGNTTVTWIVKDASNNMATATQIVTVKGLDVTVTNNAGKLSVAETAGSYRWLTCNNGTFTAIPNEINSYFTPMKLGSYAVEVTKNGCSATSPCSEINVLGTNDFEIQNSFRLSPNPTKDFITIEVNSFDNAKLSVFDMTGHFIFSKELKDISTTLNISNLSVGVYMFRVSNESGTVNKKVIKK